MASAAPIGLFLFLALFCARIHVIVSLTNDGDAAALQSMKSSWENTPPTWQQSNDPCGFPWEGVTCKDSRVTALGLPAMGLKGRLSGDIGSLTELISLDLSYNKGLTGSLTPRLGDLKNLNILILQGCSFTGNIPSELGNLAELSFLALNTNNLSGGIPPSLGKLSKLYWLDLAENQLTGPLPVSTDTTPGLDQLHKAKHFHFNKNQLSGSIPAQLFSSDMILIHVLFDSNKLTGGIPATIGLVQTLEVLRLDRNSLTGAIPSTISNLTNINELHLAQNELSGTVPDLSPMTSLNYLDLSNNSFLASEAPAWFTSLTSLNTLVMEYSSLQGSFPPELLSFPRIQVVKLKNNAFNGTLTIGGANFSPQLELIDLENNQISIATLGSGFNTTLKLMGNPVCDSALANTVYCRPQ
ncbi:probable leucine-rich repeat receptor-like protein kinase At5g49770 [Tripterygium wilfordii]|uniref:probable leucine-rich repeat receptor-like protein kinase At5g49770 n=1 Tax=Tripterygium wilfordii TaxID=458696 RepID=UPI0018F80D8C|nr:probable leucine-rich repeat receptor-like protein kinase At5g49770 [Tripterygium wilfordii]